MPAGPPFSALLSQALIAIALEFERAGAGGAALPTLEMRSNLLRCLDSADVPGTALPALTRLSRRAARAGAGRAQRQRWIEARSGPAGSRAATYGLTRRGRIARDTWPELDRTVSRTWRSIVGKDAAAALCGSLEAAVASLRLELPHFPAGYGPADASITGSDGQDWKPVPRPEGGTVSALGLPALLSQAPMAYTMDYEAGSPVPLALNATVLQHLDSEHGRPVTGLPASGGVAVLERHGFVDTFRDPDSGRQMRARLTERGWQARNGYESLTEQTDQQWETRHGPGLRTALAQVTRGLDLPHHPIGMFDQHLGLFAASTTGTGATAAPGKQC